MQKLFTKQMGMKVPSLDNLTRIDSLDTFFIDFRKLVALGDTRHCVNIVYSESVINFFNKKQFWLSIGQNIQCCLVHCLSMHFSMAYTLLN